MDVRVKVGDHVEAGEAICVLSAMKMETVVSAPISGKVTEVLIAQGESVDGGDLVARIEG